MTRFSKKVAGNLPAGTAQTQLDRIATTMPEAFDIRVLGDHSVGLGAAFEAINCFRSPEKWLPVTGALSQVVRRGNKILVDLDTLTVERVPLVDPRKTTMI